MTTITNHGCVNGYMVIHGTTEPSDTRCPLCIPPTPPVPPSVGTREHESAAQLRKFALACLDEDGEGTAEFVRDVTVVCDALAASRSEVQRLTAEVAALRDASAADCRCGSGSHPRTCPKHHHAKAIHVLELNLENANAIAEAAEKREAIEREGREQVTAELVIVTGKMADLLKERDRSERRLSRFVRRSLRLRKKLHGLRAPLEMGLAGLMELDAIKKLLGALGAPASGAIHAAVVALESRARKAEEETKRAQDIAAREIARLSTENAQALKDWGALRSEHTALSARVKELEGANEELRRQLTNQRDNNHERNVALDALHYVWCDGGCESGVHRHDGKGAEGLTAEIMEAARKNMARLETFWANAEGRRTRGPR